MPSLRWKLSYWLTIQPRLNKLKKLLPDCSIHPIGSRYICDPPVMNTDVDFLIYSPAKVLPSTHQCDQILKRVGYKNSVYSNAGSFTSLRKGVVNVSITAFKVDAEAFLIATHICRDRNVRLKDWRIGIHEWLKGDLDHIIQYFPIYEETFTDDPYDVVNLIYQLTGEHSTAIRKAYMIKHDLKL